MTIMSRPSQLNTDAEVSAGNGIDVLEFPAVHLPAPCQLARLERDKTGERLAIAGADSHSLDGAVPGAWMVVVGELK